MLQDALSHLGFDGVRFGTIRQNGPSFIKDLSEDNQGFGIITGHGSTSRSPFKIQTWWLSVRYPTYSKKKLAFPRQRPSVYGLSAVFLGAAD
jgi:hypothetical protein